MKEFGLKLVFLSCSIAPLNAMAQKGGEQVSYKFTDIKIDDPELIVGAGIGLYLPGLMGYEITAMGTDIVIPGLWGDFRYLSSSGLIQEDSTLLADSSETKLRAGYTIGSSVMNRDTSVVLSSSTSYSENKRITETVTLPVNAPTKEATIVYGSVTMRNANLYREVENSVGGDRRENDRMTSTLIGVGMRWQKYQNIAVSIDGKGSYRSHNLFGYDIEIMNGDKGAFKGLHWAFSFDSWKLPWYLRTTIGSGISGLEEDMPLVESLVVQLGFGYTFSTNLTRTPITWDANCWQTKRDLEGCKI